MLSNANVDTPVPHSFSWLNCSDLICAAAFAAAHAPIPEQILPGQHLPALQRPFHPEKRAIPTLSERYHGAEAQKKKTHWSTINWKYCGPAKNSRVPLARNKSGIWDPTATDEASRTILIVSFMS